MRFLLLMALAGCSVNRAKMTGVVVSSDVYFDGWIPVRVTNAPTSPVMWVRLDRKQLEVAKLGSDVVFYIESPSVLKAELP